MTIARVHAAFTPGGAPAKVPEAAPAHRRHQVRKDRPARGFRAAGGKVLGEPIRRLFGWPARRFLVAGTALSMLPSVSCLCDPHHKAHNKHNNDDRWGKLRAQHGGAARSKRILE